MRSEGVMGISKAGPLRSVVSSFRALSAVRRDGRVDAVKDQELLRMWVRRERVRIGDTMWVRYVVHADIEERARMWRLRIRQPS